MAALVRKISVIIAAGFGIGYLLPIGQGTLATLPFLFFVNKFLGLSLFTQATFIFIGVAGAVYVSGTAEKLLGQKDDHRIVIDEIISIFITFAGIQAGLPIYFLIVGLFLNRLFDWLKPYPANKLQNLPGGWGIMLDDVVSGIYSNIILRIFIFLIL